MHLELAKTLRNYDRKNLSKDILTGLIIMAVSIPISMGYAQIAGLPAVYGLYGSVFPIILFGLFSTSPQFIFGVDAAPAALVGAALVEMGIQSGSKQAMAVVPVLTFFVAVWLFVFAFLKAGKLVNYISAPVMGGFITGICTTIILMQVPKNNGRNCRNRRIVGAGRAYLGYIRADQSAVPDFRSGFSGHPSGDEKNPAQVSYGSSSDGSRCIIILFRPDFQLGNPYTGCSRTGAACMEYS